ncbi:MAG: TRAP transporter substrate-binding protein [Acetobacteraceae bacterium]|nr:TRAP transporter substrate-binding protein [Acetobacteraceae bacterium]
MSLSIGRRTIVAGALAAPFIVPSAKAVAQGRMLKLTLADNVSSPVYAIAQRFAANLNEKSGGAINVQVYGAGQLGSQTNALTSLQTGIIDFVIHTNGYMETIFPKLAVLDLPFLFRDAAAAEALLDGPIGQELFEPFPERGIYGLCWGHWGWRPFSTTTPAPMPKPADMAGLKVRIQPGAIYAETYKTLGAIPVAIDISEVYLALSQGAVGAVELPLISMVANKLQEVVKHTNDNRMTYNAGALMVSKRRFDSFSPEQQAIVRTCAKELSTDWRTSVAAATVQAEATLKAAGVTIGPIDTAAFVAATKPIYAMFRPIIGEKLMDEVLKQVGS